ncbi:MAG: hypothetical protein JXP36_03640, partial [Bacteroidales bacterium]|nr:hypothetical protein [Bacteroidales bacterium]
MNPFTKNQNIKVIFDNYVDIASVKKSFLIKPVFDIKASYNCLSDYLNTSSNSTIDKFKSLNQSLILYPNNKEAVKSYALWLQKQGHFDEALEYYRKWKRLAGINNKTNRNTERTITLNNVVKVSDKRLVAFSQEGDCYLRLPYKPVAFAKIIANSRKSILTKIAGYIIAFWLWNADTQAQYYAAPDIEWLTQQKHADIRYIYFEEERLKSIDSRYANTYGVVNRNDENAQGQL